MSRYIYSISKIHADFSTLTEAKKFVRYLIQKDSGTSLLFRDNYGRFIIKKYSGKRCKYICDIPVR